MPMKGKFPLRRTIRYLEQGKIYLRDSVKILTINYNSFGKESDGARDFVFYHLPQLQYKNPNVQMQTFKNITPSPFIRCFLNEGEEVLIDIEDKTKDDIEEHLNKVLGKSERVLATERKAMERSSNPANFGRTFARWCICEVPGQFPCPKLKPMPNEMKGKYRDLKEDSLRAPEALVHRADTPTETAV
ncbi:small ribosomal subunit protein mS25-like [Lytechinus pictus]|uniref:small ribosomal subunit protein mS25-like n=1 Tax=Lytechinus pictus TaxID=7653 RepID=UPI00240E8E36|nr:28S ribosomal protein S25, mitochondrial-like [Lytechinus pictus]